MKYSQSIFCHEATSEKAINQDYAVSGSLGNTSNCWIAVADGIGQFYKSEEASKFVCQYFQNSLKNWNSLEVDFQSEFENVVIELKKAFLESHPNEDPLSSYGTTLIIGIEMDNEYVFAYVGNGGILHISGDFNDFESRKNLPWSSINLLNPHSIEIKNRNVLQRYISPSLQSNRHNPSIIKISKDQFKAGEIIMLCTDGIFSNDETIVGDDDKGEKWIKSNKALEQFYIMLDEFFKSDSYSKVDLEKLIREYITLLKVGNALEDDAALAVIISPQTLEFQFSKNNVIEDE